MFNNNNNKKYSARSFDVTEAYATNSEWHSIGGRRNSNVPVGELLNYICVCFSIAVIIILCLHFLYTHWRCITFFVEKNYAMKQQQKTKKMSVYYILSFDSQPLKLAIWNIEVFENCCSKLSFFSTENICNNIFSDEIERQPRNILEN